MSRFREDTTPDWLPGISHHRVTDKKTGRTAKHAFWDGDKKSHREAREKCFEKLLRPKKG